ncbi:hypothetical protein DICPUDRAFT_26215 [Dictyostelium purpureum]|uniref:COMM domain-containing protein 1 n=1 Tax=Dictyostelium purpureum TaxID=5786 RepID=F0Z8C5_DICPU|nr:uncharacterized protein DICPUDRAFT_26215 [Dictyostelium purpureum]EGC39791.1 hypothetical protein DICPUDRAFT_26215 [Dictyostelium purpureum]|eukprot:XP_003283658.1 hypothetical protein DICPUDRAFT_26215 [Dictyostelium purpureum]
MEQPKYFSSLLGFLLKKEYEKDPACDSIETLKELVFSEQEDVTLEIIEATYNKCFDIIQKAAYSDMQLSSFENLVKESNFSEIQIECLNKFWKVNKKKIHEILYKITKFNNSLQKMSWRIDLKTKSKEIKEINEPVSIIELKLKNNNTNSNTTNDENNIIRFEMDKNQLEETLQQINNIQKHLQTI